MEHWGGLQAVFNGTKQNVVASSDFECLLWGMKETGPLHEGMEGGECHVGEGTQLQKASKQGGSKALGVEARVLDAGSPWGHLQKRQANDRLPVADLGRIRF